MAFPFVYPFVGAPGSVDPDQGAPESLLQLPWAINAVASWLDYRCWVEVMLDAGLALHKTLPQSNPQADTLGKVAIDDPQGDKKFGGVNVAGTGVSDVIQRMATSTYTFILRGFGTRVGYQIPIPKLVRVGKAGALPGTVQRAFNVIVGNFAGIPVWFAAWELHYYIPVSPGTASPGGVGLTGTNTAPVPFNPAYHIRPDAELPQGILLPQSESDQNSVQQSTLVAGGVQ